MTGQRRDVADWLRSKRTQESIAHLSDATGIPVANLSSIVLGKGKLQGTWIHPRLAVRFAMWVSDEFGYMVEEWVEQWATNSAGIVEQLQPQPQKPALPTKHLARPKPFYFLYRELEAGRGIEVVVIFHTPNQGKKFRAKCCGLQT